MGAYVAHQLDAIALLEADVGDHHLRVELLDGGARVPRRLRLAAHHEVVLVLHDPPQTLANDRVIIDDQHAPDPALAGADPGLRGRGTNPCIASDHIHFLHIWRARSVAHPRPGVVHPSLELSSPAACLSQSRTWPR